MSNGGWIVLAAAVGGVTGAIGAMLGGIVERSSRARQELVAAAAEWLAAVEGFSIAAQIDASMTGDQPNAAGKLLERVTTLIEETLGKSRVEMARALVHGSYISRVERATDRVTLATTRLVLLAPTGLVRQLEPHIETFVAFTRNPTDEKLAARWNDEGRTETTKVLHNWTRPAWRHPLLRLRG